ncbi:D-aspartate oxidase [Cladobotryum mycophilum]|uniref:D-aspartate oxidase n=1 Tax=Cladobotryum mycophilum TaxID=491253 RepID=A0ABR0SQ20_9HYPO
MSSLKSTPTAEFSLRADISASPDPLCQPTVNAPHVLVIGGGVTGLVTAWLLLDRGYHVTIISKEWASYGSGQRLTSQISGALWELPPTQCGGVLAVQQEISPGDLKTVQNWALESFAIYGKMAANPELAIASGVKMKMCTLFHAYEIVGDDITYRKMKLAEKISPEGFHWGIDLMEKYGVNVEAHRGLKDAYEHLAPVIDTDVAMSFLMRLVKTKGAILHTGTVVGDLLQHEPHLLRVYNADAIVNATGMARETAADDDVYPLRGAVLRVINDGSSFPRIESSFIVTAETKADGTYEDIAFIVPRNDNILVLGSIEQPHKSQLDLTPDSPEIKEMRRRCEDLLPILKNAKLDPEYPLAQGLRPYRDSRIRLERENRKTLDKRESRVVHCYGHGGAGWSLAFGTSNECVRLVEEVIQGIDKPISGRI